MVHGFPRMADRLPAGSVGEAEVTHFDVSQSEASLSFIRRENVRPGRYARLRVGGVLMMTDTDMERRTNWEVAHRANGDVLIAGLGLGMILDPILAKDDVRSVTVVERSADVIALVGPHYPSPKLEIVHADIFDWRPAKGRAFDAIYFDIWPDKCDDNLDEMARLHRRFARSLNRDNPRCWMDSWCRDELRRRRRSERRQMAWYL